jgi:hypothetical protein
MSDYLDNLVARSCNLTEVAQPRPVSLFEPPPGTTWSPSNHLPALETVEGEPALGERPPDAPGITRSAARHSPAAPRATSAGVEPEPPAASPAYPDARMAPRGPQSAPAPHDWDGAQPQPLRLRPEPSLAQTVSAPASGTLALAASTRIVESVPQRPGEGRPGTTPAGIAAVGNNAPHGAVERTVIERIVPLATPPLMQIVSPTSQAAPLVEVTKPGGLAVIKATLARPDPTQPAPVIARPHSRPYLEPAPPPTTCSTARPAPTIQVTIGRLEVRTTPPPLPPSKERSTPLVMSLDDYLRQRNGGRR